MCFQPICNKLKKYIEALDIEADARLLHENLNIPGAAIDYFRASSALLKTGARAGLSLYDIACMCCRNDNLAEVPSMMENMFSMASRKRLDHDFGNSKNFLAPPRIDSEAQRHIKQYQSADVKPASGMQRTLSAVAKLPRTRSSERARRNARCA